MEPNSTGRRRAAALPVRRSCRRTAGAIIAPRPTAPTRGALRRTTWPSPRCRAPDPGVHRRCASGRRRVGRDVRHGEPGDRRGAGHVAAGDAERHRPRGRGRPALVRGTAAGRAWRRPTARPRSSASPTRSRPTPRSWPRSTPLEAGKPITDCRETSTCPRRSRPSAGTPRRSTRSSTPSPRPARRRWA